MKKASGLFVTALLLISFCGKAQYFYPVHNYQAPDGLAVIKYFGIPYGATPVLNTSRIVPGALFYRTTDSSLYSWTGFQWIKFSGGSGSGDTTSLSNRINYKWDIRGNTGVTSSNFLGTTNNASLRFRTNGVERMKLDSVGSFFVGAATVSNIAPINNASQFILHSSSTQYAGAYIILNSGTPGAVTDSGSAMIAYGDYTRASPGTSEFRVRHVSNGVITDHFKLDNSGRAVFGSNSAGALAGAVSAKLDIQSTTGGFLAPRMTSAQMLAIVTPIQGLMVFCIDSVAYCYYTGSIWLKMSGGTGGGGGISDGNNYPSSLDFSSGVLTLGRTGLSNLTSNLDGWYLKLTDTSTLSNRIVANTNSITALGTPWKITGNSGTDTATNWIGTNDAHNLLFKVNGFRSGIIDYTGSENTAFGYKTLQYSGGAGNKNSAFGIYTLQNNSSGTSNTALGGYSLILNTTGSQNMAMGSAALFNNTSGSSNSAIGVNSLYYNISGSNNIAIGTNSGLKNTGSGNVFIGNGAMMLYNSSNVGNIGHTIFWTNDSGHDSIAGTTNLLAIGNTTPVSMFNVGTANQFQVNTTGNIIKINNVTTSFPSSQGAAKTSLINNGTGALNWNLLDSSNSASGFGHSENYYRGIFPDMAGAYINPPWITSIPYSKLTSVPAFGISVNGIVTGPASITGKVLSDAGSWVAQTGGLTAAQVGQQIIDSSQALENSNIGDTLIRPIPITPANPNGGFQLKGLVFGHRLIKGTGSVTDSTLGFDVDVSDHFLRMARNMGGSIKAYGTNTPATATTNFTWSSPTARVSVIEIDDTTTVTGVAYDVTTAGVYIVGPLSGYNGFGLCSVSGGVCTAVAVTANDSTIWKNGTGWLKKSFSAPVLLQPGTYYIEASFNNTSQTTSPISAAGVNFQNTGLSSQDFTNSNKLSASLSAPLTSLAIGNTFNLSAATSSTANPQFWLY